MDEKRIKEMNDEIQRFIKQYNKICRFSYVIISINIFIILLVFLGLGARLSFNYWQIVDICVIVSSMLNIIFIKFG